MESCPSDALVSNETNTLLTTSTGALIDLESIATVHRGCIEGANFVVAEPREKGHCLLIHCHGFRPEGTPPFAEMDDLFWLRLVQQGWTVAVTSYRRSGLIVGDAIRDVFNLHNWVCKEVGIPAFSFLDGRSMGGAISTRIAEKLHVNRVFQGVLAIGAALMVKEDEPGLELTYRPTIPIVYLTNTSELGQIRHYIAKVKEQAELDRKNRVFGGDEVMVPALHHVVREGHNWTNPRERWRAFSTVVEWAFVGSLVTEFTFDGTNPGTATGGQCTREKIGDKEYLVGRVTFCEDLTSFRTNFTLSDLHEIRVRINTVLTLRLESGREVPVHLGSYPFVGVRDDSVVMGEDPENWLCLFAMSEFRNKPATAVLDLGLKVGDRLWIQVPVELPRTPGRRNLPMPPPIDL